MANFWSGSICEGVCNILRWYEHSYKLLFVSRLQIWIGLINKLFHETSSTCTTTTTAAAAAATTTTTAATAVPRIWRLPKQAAISSVRRVFVREIHQKDFRQISYLGL